jgi:CDGSH-type Zn-finger protein
MATKSLPDQALLRQLLDYDPATGVLTWKVRPPEMFLCKVVNADDAARRFNTRFAGTVALNALAPSGYRFGSLGHTPMMAHRIIWKLVYGHDPKIIDHINGNKQDNRLVNLRNVTASINLKNMPKARHNTSGHTGVHLCRKTGRWRAELYADGRHIRIGRFDTVEEAAKARRDVGREYGFHENHGR